MSRKKTDKSLPQTLRGAIAPEMVAPVSPRVPIIPRDREGTTIVELVGLDDSTYNTIDPLTGRQVFMRLFRGENSVLSTVFAAFLDDQYFREYFLGVQVVDKSPPPSIDDIGEEVEL